MSLIAQKKNKYLFPEGSYQGILVGIYDIGTHYSEKFKKETEQVVFIWELPEAESELDTPVTLWTTCTNSLHEIATLRKHVEAILQRDLSEDEAEEGVELNKLLGGNAKVQVIKSKSNRRSRMRIKEIEQLDPNTKKLKSYSEHIYYELDPRQDIPEGTPEWIKSHIESSKEWEAGVSDEEKPPAEETLKEPF